MPNLATVKQTGASSALFIRARLRPLGLAALVAGFAMLTACAGSRGGPIPYEVQDFGKPDSPAPLALEADYKIAPLDTLTIRVFQVADLSGEFEVDLTGRIALPLIGNVKAIDQTTTELDERITQMLSAKYLQNPDVTVGVKESSTRVVTVDGSVRAPGVFPVRGQMTLMQVVAMARGTDDSSNPRRVAIFRQIQGQRMAAAFDLVSIRRGQMEDPRIYSGDIVVVDGSKIRALQREILSALPLLSVFNPVAAF
ncbi:MAG: polysaccharide biosynthesis/export family protein [Allosphingosinicella sp.]